MRALMQKPLIRLFVVNGAFGALLGLAFVLAALALDMRGLRTLVAGSEHAFLALALLTVSLSATFAGAAIGTAVMMLPSDEDAFRAIGRDGEDPDKRR